MNVIKITGENRSEFGKTANTHLRMEGRVPCVLYGGDEVKHFHIDKSDLKSFVYSPDFHLIELSLDGKTIRTILKDAQFHPVTEEVEHMDFQELTPGRKVKVWVPVRFTGDAEGVREGGSIVTVIRKLHIKATPDKLVHELTGDISNLKLSQSICVRDMNIPEGIEVLHEQGAPVGYIAVPRSLKSLESSAEQLDVEEETTEEVAEEAEAPVED